MTADDSAILKLFLGSLSGVLTGFLAFLARDFSRDKKFQAIREEQKENFTCKLKELNQDYMEKYECGFSNEDHSRISDSLLLQKTEEIWLKSMLDANSKHESEIDKLHRSVESWSNEIRQRHQFIIDTLNEMKGKIK